MLVPKVVGGSDVYRGIVRGEEEEEELRLLKKWEAPSFITLLLFGR